MRFKHEPFNRKLYQQVEVITIIWEILWILCTWIKWCLVVSLDIVLDVYAHTSCVIIHIIHKVIFTTVFISYFVPLQAPLVAFVGNLCTSMLCLVFPALMEICILYPSDFGKYNFLLIKDIIVITIGLLSWVFGVILIGYVIYLRLLQLNKPESEYLWTYCLDINFLLFWYISMNKLYYFVKFFLLSNLYKFSIINKMW